MRYIVASTFLLAGLGLAQKWEGFEAIPDGAYEGLVWPNGSTTIRAFDNPSFSPVTLHLSPETEKRDILSKRLYQCWGTAMDPVGTDGATNDLRFWASPTQGETLIAGDTPVYHAEVFQGMMAYYCINAPNTVGNLNLVDVNYAFEQMDSNCPLYTAGFFEWPGSYEIVGKCAQGIAVCLGGLKG